jgi:hypothetical protein
MRYDDDTVVKYFSGKSSITAGNMPGLRIDTLKPKDRRMSADHVGGDTRD